MIACLSSREFSSGAITLTVMTLLFSAGGCGESTALNDAFYPVKGRVLQTDGKPLSSGYVIFMGKTSGLTSSAPIGSDGAFEIKGSKDGLPQGDYRIKIDPDSAATPQVKRPKNSRSKISVPFPEKYLDEDASGLSAAVKPDSAGNDFTFTLSK